MAFPSATWSKTTTYAINDLVDYQGTDYISLAGGNLNNVPTATLGTKWSLYTNWSAGTTYSAGQTVTYNGFGYVSLVNSNLNHIPSSTTGVWWDRTIVKSIWAIPPTVASTTHSFGTVFFMLTSRDDGKFRLSEPGSPSTMGHVGLVFSSKLVGAPMSSPGPASVWLGRAVFRVSKPGWFFGLGQRANKPPAMHNSGE